MRVAIASCFVALFVAQSAIAQQDQGEPPTKAIYFLIDASDSMNGIQDRADALVESKLKSYIAGAPQRLFYSYFQGCRKAVEISEPNSKPPRPDAIGGTPLGAALATAIEHAGAGPADIFIVTDGNQTDSCGPDICSVARDMLPKPSIHVEPITIRSSPASRDRIACIEGAQFGDSLMPVQKSLTEVLAPSADNEKTTKNEEQPLTWLTTSLFIGIGAIAFGVVLLLLMASRRNEEIASGDEPSRQWTGWVMFWITSIVAVVSLGWLFGMAGPQFSTEWPTLYRQLNGSLLSLLVSNAALGLIGWCLIQVWGINEFRQKNSSRKWKLNQEEKQFTQIEKPSLDRRRATKIREAKTVELRFLFRYFGTLDKDALKKAWEIVEEAREHIETIVAVFIGSAGYDKRRVIRELSTLPRYDYLPLIDILREEERLEPSSATDLEKLFADWELVKSKRGENREAALQTILGFDAKTLKKPKKSQ
jgi:hypothetical protein